MCQRFQRGIVEVAAGSKNKVERKDGQVKLPGGEFMEPLGHSQPKIVIDAKEFAASLGKFPEQSLEVMVISTAASGPR